MYPNTPQNQAVQTLKQMAAQIRQDAKPIGPPGSVLEHTYCVLLEEAELAAIEALTFEGVDG